MKRALLVALAVAATASGCWREKRDFRGAPAAAARFAPVRIAPLQPGQALPEQGVIGPYDNNAWAISEGQRLYGWYNCSGCHFQGGGGIGPPLMDDEWIYGSDPENIVATIVEGRPNGMPSFRGRIPNQQLWQVAAYVRSLAGLTPKAPSPGRDDDMQYKVDEQRTPFRTPRSSASRNVPAKSERP